MKTSIRAAILALVFLAATTASALEVPRYSDPVNDTAGVMSPSAQQALTDRIKTHEGKTGNQIVVLTIPSLEGEDIEGYAVRVFESWKPGKKGKDNGILVVVATKDRRMRIEVGYGLEGTLPDSAAGEIIRTAMAPQFKKGDYSGGIDAGVTAIITLLETGEQPATVEEGGGKFSDQPLSGQILSYVFLLVIPAAFAAYGILSPGVAGWIFCAIPVAFFLLFPPIVYCQMISFWKFLYPNISSNIILR